MTPRPNYLAQQRERDVAGYTQIIQIWSLLLGCAAILSALYVTFHSLIRFPFEDQWSILAELGTLHGWYPLSLLWALHNEHRTPFAKLLETADLYWFHGRNTSLYLEIYALQAINLAAWVWTLRRIAQWPGWLVGTGAGLAAFALFWVSQHQSFNPLGVGILPATAFGFFAVLFLVLAALNRKHAVYWLLASAASAFVTEGTLASGILLWPLLVILGLRFRVRLWLVALLAVIGALATYAYVSGFHSPAQAAPPLESIRHPAVVTEYLLIYFGNAWASVNETVRKVLAALGVLLAAGCYAREFLRPALRTFSLLMLTLCMFCLGTGVLTALGRINLGLQQATQSRYQSSVLLFWLCLALYALDSAMRHGLRTALLASSGILLLTMTTLTSFSPSLEASEQDAGRMNAGALPIFADVKDDAEIFNNLIVDARLVFQERSMLRAIPAAFYVDPRYLRLGRKLDSTFSVASENRCFGALDVSRRVTDSGFPGWQLSGWAWDHQSMRPVEGITAVTEGAIINGAGVSDMLRPDVRTVHIEVSNPNVGWRMYVRGKADLPAIRVYGIVDDGKTVCLVKPVPAAPK